MSELATDSPPKASPPDHILLEQSLRKICAGARHVLSLDNPGVPVTVLAERDYRRDTYRFYHLHENGKWKQGILATQQVRTASYSDMVTDLLNQWQNFSLEPVPGPADDAAEEKRFAVGGTPGGTLGIVLDDAYWNRPWVGPERYKPPAWLAGTRPAEVNTILHGAATHLKVHDRADEPIGPELQRRLEEHRYEMKSDAERDAAGLPDAKGEHYAEVFGGPLGDPEQPRDYEVTNPTVDENAGRVMRSTDYGDVTLTRKECDLLASDLRLEDLWQNHLKHGHAKNRVLTLQDSSDNFFSIMFTLKELGIELPTSTDKRGPFDRPRTILDVDNRYV